MDLKKEFSNKLVNVICISVEGKYYKFIAVEGKYEQYLNNVIELINQRYNICSFSPVMYKNKYRINITPISEIIHVDDFFILHEKKPRYKKICEAGEELLKLLIEDWIKSIEKDIFFCDDLHKKLDLCYNLRENCALYINEAYVSEII